MHNQQIRLTWVTHDGCEWLTRTCPLDVVTRYKPELQEKVIAKLVKDYYLETAPCAKLLVNGWRRNGEDVSLFMVGECHANAIIERTVLAQMDLLDPS